MTASDPRTDFAEPSTYSLDPERIVHTISTLGRRIEERFPEAGLRRVCATLVEIGEETKTRLDDVESPIIWRAEPEDLAEDHDPRRGRAPGGRAPGGRLNYEHAVRELSSPRRGCSR